MSSVYRDIFWVEDFESKNQPATTPRRRIHAFKAKERTGGSDTIEENPIASHKDEVSDYIPEAYWFRLQLFTQFFSALQNLSEHADQYSCALLDINLKNGFKNKFFPPDVQDEPAEFEAIQNLLAEKNICIRTEDDYAGFQENAGYYLYLYLIQCGMPEDRIVILTGNTGQNAEKSEDYQNLTDRWKELFEKAGMKAPQVIEKRDDDSCIEDVQEWFDRVLTPPYELRSCVMMMSHCLRQNLPSILLPPDEGNGKKQNCFYHGFAFRSKDDYQKKARFLLDDLCFLSIRMSGDATRFFYNIIWQIAQPWEASLSVTLKDGNAYGYWTTMRTARNWMAHDVIQQFDALEVEAFLFGLSMRGMFSIAGLPELEREVYEQWEDVLLRLLNPTFAERYDEAAAKEKIQELEQLTMDSFYRFHSKKRAGSNGIHAFYTDIGALIYDLGTAKKKKACFASDLLRDFLHACVPIRVDLTGEKRGTVRLRIRDNVLDGNQGDRRYYRHYLCDGAEHDAPNRLWAYITSIVPLIRDELDHNEDA